MPQYVVIRRRPGNAGIVRNIAAGVAGGLAAGWGAIAGRREETVIVRAAPAAPTPVSAPAPTPTPPVAAKTFTEAEVDDNYEEIEDVIVRYMTNPDYSDDTRKAFVQFLGEFNRTFRGE